MGVHERMTGAQRVAKRRAKLRAQGLRLKQFWVPDLRDPQVRENIRSSARLINELDRRDGVMTYLETVSDEVMNAVAADEEEDREAE